MDQYPKFQELVSVVERYLIIEKPDFYRAQSDENQTYDFAATISKYKDAIAELKSYIDSESYK